MTTPTTGAGFCEACGRRGEVSAPGRARGWHLVPCPGCGLLVCGWCRRGRDRCDACPRVDLLPARPIRRRSHVATGLLVALWLFLVGVWAATDRPRGEVLAERGSTQPAPAATLAPPVAETPSPTPETPAPTVVETASPTPASPPPTPETAPPPTPETAPPTPETAPPTAPPTPETAPPTAPPETAPPTASPAEPTALPGAGSVAVVDWSVPAWEDALGARHAEALFVIENRGPDPVELIPAASRFAVTGAAGEVASGALDAAIPPVLAPGYR